MVSKGKGILNNFISLILPWLIVAVLFIYIIIRAVTVPITHDEVATSIYFAPMNLHDIVSYADPSPNNHILNTLLVKCTEYFFGTSQFTVRIPSILSFIIYSIFSILFARAVSKKPAVRLFALCVLLFNLFLLDFFSLARGYALSISLMLGASYIAYRWLQTNRLRHLATACFVAILSVYANFTILVYFVPFIGLLFICCFQGLRRHILLSLSVILLSCVVLAVASYIPIMKMTATNQFETWTSRGFYIETLSSMTYAWQYGHSYLGTHDNTTLVLNIIVIALFGLMLFTAIRQVVKNRFDIRSSPFVFFTLLFTGAVLFSILQNLLLKTPCLTGRTALLYYPLFALSAIFFMGGVAIKFPTTAYITSSIVILFLSYHVLANHNTRSCFEWYYGENDKQVVQYMEKVHKSKPNDSITLNCTWFFHPALNFYIKTIPLPWLKLTEYHKEVQPLSITDYYYVMNHEEDSLKDRYDVVLHFPGNDRIIMQLKTALKDSLKTAH